MAEYHLAMCGCDCSTCPTFKKNLKTNEDRIRCSRGWYKYFAIKLKPEKLRPCDGCAVPDKERKIIYLNCRVRKCAISNGVKNCAYCSSYPCVDVETIHSVQRPDALEKIEKRIGGVIPREDYCSFIEPYEGIKRLNKIMESLKPTDIIEMMPVSKKHGIIAFPEDFPAGIGRSAYCQIHGILSSIGLGENVSYARSVVLDKNRKQILKLLWVFGRVNPQQRKVLSRKDYSVLYKNPGIF
jgi:hypothetical protein